MSHPYFLGVKRKQTKAKKLIAEKKNYKNYKNYIWLYLENQSQNLPTGIESGGLIS
jgi:hypothetical protein